MLEEQPVDPVKHDSEKHDDVSEPKDTVSSLPVPSADAPVHCPYRQAALLQQALASDKMRVAFFLGAGCPVAIRVPDGETTKPLIPAVKGLTKYVVQSLNESPEHKTSFASISQSLADNGKGEPNVEEILSHVRALCEVAGSSGIDGLTKDILNKLDAAVCRATTKLLQVRLPSDDTPYHRLATWIGAIRRAYPVEIFTSNYDLLIEQALEQKRVPYFDGFVGSDRAFFDLASMEQDNLPSRWARLWKVHGSINWWRTPNGRVERRPKGDGESDQQMIYPSHLKYWESRRMPYFAMLDRLKTFLAQGQGVLVTCGYSFSDQHLNEVILQGLSGNSTAVCFGLLNGDRAKADDAVKRGQANLSLLAVDGAVLGTIDRDWRSDERAEHPLHGLAAQAGEMKGRTQAPSERCKFLLGDFRSFGEFLARQLAQRKRVEGDKDAA
jgi:SIR2-like protein